MFPRGVPIPEAALQTLWSSDGASAFQVQRWIKTLVERNLLRREASGAVSLHDHNRDYLEATTPDSATRREKLVDAYAARCPNGWHTGPDDGWFFRWLPWHLAQAQRHETLRGLLLDYRWLQAKLAYTDTVALLSDFTLPPPDSALQKIAGAIRLSAHVMYRDPALLAGQLRGRLLAEPAAEIKRSARTACVMPSGRACCR